MPTYRKPESSTIKAKRDGISVACGLRLLLACLALLGCASVSGLHAQTGLATLNGQVFDTQHGAIADADVTITNAATAAKQKMQSSADGSFRFSSLPPATYTLHVE